MNIAAAREVISGLVSALPALKPELKGLLSSLQSGERVELEGIGQPLVRAGLAALFGALGMRDGGAGGGGLAGYGLDGGDAGMDLVDLFADLLDSRSSSSSKPSSTSSAAADDAGIGPSLPSLSDAASSSPAAHAAASSSADAGADADDEGDDNDSSSDDEVGPSLDGAGGTTRRVGPALPTAVDLGGGDGGAGGGGATKRSSLPISFPSRTSLVRGDADKDIVNNMDTGPGGREAWMMAAPKELAGIQAPGQRQRGGGGGGGVGPSARSAAAAVAASAAASAPSTAASAATQFVVEYNQAHRPKSLMELHKEAQAAKAAAAGRGGDRKNFHFDREKDLDKRKDVNIDAIVSNCASLDGRFSSGQIATRFI